MAKHFAPKKPKPWIWITLTLLLVAALFSAAWLLATPHLDLEQRLAEQNHLLQIIEDHWQQLDIDALEEASSFELSASPSAIQDLNVIGILSIDRIALRLPVTEGVSESQLRIALGHVPQTAAIGEVGNAVIAGHRGLVYGQFFYRLAELQAGDIIRYETLTGEVFIFAVWGIQQINPDDQSAFKQPADHCLLTLYTCTPVNVASHRLLVQAILISGEE